MSNIGQQIRICHSKFWGHSNTWYLAAQDSWALDLKVFRFKLFQDLLFYRGFFWEGQEKGKKGKGRKKKGKK